MLRGIVYRPLPECTLVVRLERFRSKVEIELTGNRFALHKTTTEYSITVFGEGPSSDS